MNVILADVLGYCMGVRRAVDSALDALEKYKDKNINKIILTKSRYRDII